MQADDHRATRAIAVSFAVLAVYVGVESVRALASGSEPDASVVGIVMASLSLVLMPILARAKLALAPALGSAAAVADAKQTNLCALLSGGAARRPQRQRRPRLVVGRPARRPRHRRHRRRRGPAHLARRVPRGHLLRLSRERTLRLSGSRPSQAAPVPHGRSAAACSCHARRPPPRRPPRPRARLRPRDPPCPPARAARRPPPRAEAARRRRRRRRARGLQLRRRELRGEHVVELHLHDRRRPPPRPAAASSVEAVPEETGGPYPGDGSNGPNVLVESGIVRQDIRSSFGDHSGTAEGIPLNIALQVVDAATGAPRRGAAVYTWHCTREGGYSLYSTASPTRTSCAACRWPTPTATSASRSIYPGAYDGRWPHIHFEVFQDVDTATAGGNPIVTSQLALPEGASREAYLTDGYEQSLEQPRALVDRQRHGLQRRLRQPAGHGQRRPDQRLHRHPRRRRVTVGPV